MPRHHVVILGFGRVGAVLGVAPERRGIRFTVIEMNPSVVRALRAKGVRAYYGDAGVDALLLRAGVDVAKTLLVATPDLVTARAAIQHAKRINPAIIVVARAMVANEVEVLRTAGADEVAQPEIEAGMELLRHVLLRHDVSPTEVSLILGHRRASFYESDEVAPVYLDDAD
ncbi:MAG: NAD-binding protein [Thermomicrobiales bacterium]